MQDIVISDAGKYHIKTVEGAKYRKYSCKQRFQNIY